MAMPLDVLEKHMNKRLSLTLKDGRSLEGKLVGYDQYMNLVLEETEEKHSRVEAGTEHLVSRRLGVVVLRGNNVVTINPQ